MDDDRGRRVEGMGDGALRWLRAPGLDGRALLDALRAWPRVVDAVVTEEYALVAFDPSSPPDAPWTVEERLAPAARGATREHVVRARYDGEDLDEVASRASMTREAVIAAHAGREYVVRCVGFQPGFAYLGPVDPRLALPRRATPRPRVAAGSVALAAGQTAIYPFVSPGGWHLVANAVDFAPFDPERGALFAIGDRVRFEVVR